MEILTLIIANIKKRKLSFIGVFILIFIISVFLTSIITIKINSNSSITQKVEDAGYGDMLVWLSGVNNIESLEREVEVVEDVGSVKSIPIVYTEKSIVSDQETNKCMSLVVYDSANFHYQIFESDGTTIDENPEELGDNEIYVPIAFQSLYSTEIGDTAQFLTDIGSKEYVIKGFFEDPYMGGSMMGVKTILMNDEDFNYLYNTYTDATDYWMNIYQSVGSDLSYMEFETTLNKETSLSTYSNSFLGKIQSLGYMTIVLNIFVGVLSAFVIILLIVTLVVLSHSISSNIEFDYVSMGILKAVGFTKGKLRVVQIYQYSIAILAGIIIGFPLAALVIKVVNKMTVSITGVLIPDEIAIVPCLTALILVLLLIIGFIFLKTGKIGVISPLLAIRGGRKDVYFASRFKLPIFKRGMRFWLAMHQLVSNPKQHFSALIVTAILVFFLTLVSNMGSWVGPNGEGVIAMFAPFAADLSINYIDDSVQEEAEKFIESYSEIENRFEYYPEYGFLNGNSCQGIYLSDAQSYTILSGRSCLYENEVLITQIIADDLGLSIGDTVSISAGETPKDFIISGTYQCAMDNGINFAMGFDGYRYLTGESLAGVSQYKLQNSLQADIIIENLNKEFSGKIEASTIGYEGADSIVDAVDALSLLMYLIAIIFILIVIVLMCDKIFIKEQHDIGIYKSVGLTSPQLRLQFAARFTVVALVGGIVGIVLNLFLTNPCMEALLSLAGITKFETEFTLTSMTIPVIFIAFLFFVFGYLASRKIKRVEIKDLIVD